MSETKIDCVVTESGFVAGAYHEEGEKLSLTQREFDCGIRRGRVEETKEVKEPEGVKEPKKVKSNKQKYSDPLS
jgi:hypothetical protein